MGQNFPEPTFEVLVSTFATQAAVALGQIANPVTNKSEKDLPSAKFAIDLLQILDEKTKDNRTAEEDKFLSDCLYQLRMVYIDQSAGGGT
ncbi:MAG: DUF1844 domain-containing protein [Planctomycetota bacterium]|nr:DUF1844 domain-containing protein [Planctomycetota bacterium]